MFAAGKTAAVSGAAPDSQFNYVTMLLHGDGTNGAQNNTFLDSSTNNFSITRNGNTTQGSFSPYGSNWSNSFNGTSSYLTLSSNASMSFGTSNFTIEGWFFTGDKSISGGASRTLIGNSGNSYTEQLYISTSGYLTFGNTGSTFIQGSTDLANNTWHHFAVSRSGTSTNQIAMWVDGTRVAQGTNSQNYTSGTIYIGAFGTTDGFWNGYISNLRIVKGSAVYDPANSTITVSTTPLTAITNTALLTCQTNRFFDGSANAYTVTPTSTPSVQRFNPFGTSTAYSTSVIGGSGYFDGSGDYLTISTTSAFGFGTGSLTAECWIYPTVLGSITRDILEFRQSNTTQPFAIQINSSNTVFVYNGSAQSSTGTVILNTWNHIAFVRNGSSCNLYLNGVSVSSFTDSSDYRSTNPLSIGTNQFSTSEIFQGYISDVRVVKGTAVYTSTFTPPTAPLTAITNTSLLTNFTNGAIYDNAMMNDLETVGNAQISTSVKKYGTGSLAFDGTGDYLKGPPNPWLALGANDYTIEMWVNFNSVSTSVLFGNIDGSGNGNWAFFYNSTAAVLRLLLNNSAVLLSSSSWTPSTGTWYHIAICRASGTYRFFINGTVTGSGSNSTNIDWGGLTNSFYVGSANDGTLQLNGYIDDLRITKGYARYTANFTPPTAALSDTGPY